MNLTTPYADDVATFAESIRRHTGEHLPDDAWVPGGFASDTSPALLDALTAAGWLDLPGEGDAALSYVGVGGFELGQLCAPYDCVSTLLGGAILVDNLVLYGKPGDTVVSARPDGTLARRILVRAEPVPYTDSLGVHRAHELSVERVAFEPETLRAWQTATVGYFAGLAAAALNRAVLHATSREAFGTTLASLDPVRHKLADAALVAESLRLTAVHASDGLPALAFACSRSKEVAAHAHQILGAMGFTREYDLQRFTRRIRALSVLIGAWVERSLG